MEDLDPPDSINLLTMELLEAKELYDNILNWAIVFKKNYSEINDINKLEYSGLCGNLNQFYKSAKEASKLNPRDFLFGDRKNISKRRDFSNGVLKELKLYLNTIGAMANPGTEEYEKKEPTTFIQPDHFSFKPPIEYKSGSGDYEFPESI